ncbi:hypothetical protein NGM10_11310 [Halorussus salilacus]|uniref:hypothetical protein n=1 Tax=Halorussus salilacus TaxID=2953750 RepID=UPI0020A1AA3C|nr:hypothetical protein [Halorussus salilacus]USZ67317.1 hypothetical protein NGM10_11310 [Halorussus salilacus]
MGTSDITGTARRLDRWLGAQLDRVLLRKYRLEAMYREKRAERARARGDLSTAADHYERAVTLRGRLGDRETVTELGTELGELARKTGDLATAREQFERVAELHSRRENASEALAAIEQRIDIANREGEDDALSEWWANALVVLGKAEPGEIDEERRDELVLDYADQIYSEDSAARLYGFALEKLVTGDEAVGETLLDATWERREVVRPEVGVFRVVLAAGVGRVARAELSGEDTDREETLDFVADHREKLSAAATALFERLSEGETDADPEDLRADEEFDRADPPDLRTLEAEVFGRLLEEL